MERVTIIFGDSLRDCKEFLEKHQDHLKVIEEFDIDDPIMMWSQSQLDMYLRNAEDQEIAIFPTS